MTQVFSPKTCRYHETDDEDDAGGVVFSPEQSLFVNIESLEDLLECPLSPYSIDSSSPLVSPISISSDNPHYQPSNRRQTARPSSTALSERAPVELPVIALLLGAFKRTGLTCKAGLNDIVKMDIGWPTNVRHIAHVTFDRFNGFLGLPVEFELEVPRRVPSASASVFGVSAESMQCSYDHKGNSVPTILLLLQERLYDQGGLQAEGIFRINAENGQEEHLRDQLNKGIVPYDIDVHCLAGLIKAWFRELPKGVLDSLTPEQVMQCHTEDQCAALVGMLPSMQAALLGWAINLMADVVQEEQHNKMNARNIAMVFAPNMTQMSDPLTALMHAVQVMNLLKTLILKTIKDRQEAMLNPRPASFCNEPRDRPEYVKADVEQRATQGVPTQIKYEIEKEGSYLKAFKESETFDEFESARDSDEMFSRNCSTREITDEEDCRGPISNGSNTLEDADDDGMGLYISSNMKSTNKAATGNAGENLPNSGGDLASYFNKAHYLPFRANGKHKNKSSKTSTQTKDFVHPCGILESKGKAKHGRVIGKVDQRTESVETW